MLYCLSSRCPVQPCFHNGVSSPSARCPATLSLFFVHRQTLSWIVKVSPAMDGSLYLFETTPSYAERRTATLSQIADAPQNYFQAADLAWMMTSSFLVLLIVPGVALFYSGVSNPQASLTMWLLPVLTTAVVGLEVICLTLGRVWLLLIIYSGISGVTPSSSRTGRPQISSGAVSKVSLCTTRFIDQFQ